MGFEKKNEDVQKDAVTEVMTETDGSSAVELAVQPEQPEKKGGFKAAMGKLRTKCRGKGAGALQIVIIVCLVACMVQNHAVSEKLNKYLGTAEGEVHEIYDDTKVVEAYKSGDASGLDEKDAFVLETASKVIDEVITEDMTPYEKEKAIYDWQVKWVNYSNVDLNPMGGSSQYNHMPYGVLKFHQAICVGNATTFKLFMDMLDIPCKIVHSTISGEHAWDVVQLDDDWYHVDVTFDGTSNGEPTYSNFNVPDSVKDTGDWPYDHNEIPAANGTKYCYMLQNATVCEDLYDIPKALKQAIDDNKGMLAVTLKDATNFNREIADYIANNVITENGFVYFDQVYSLDGKTVYKYTIYAGDDGTSEELADVYAKLDEILSKLNDGAVAGDNMYNDVTSSSMVTTSDGEVVEIDPDGNGGSVEVF